MKRNVKRITIDCFDNGGKTADRYTIAITGLMSVEDKPYTYFMTASSSPFHPQGIGKHSDEMTMSAYRARSWRHLGKRVAFTDLPADVQIFVASDFMPDEE